MKIKHLSINKLTRLHNRKPRVLLPHRSATRLRVRYTKKDKADLMTEALFYSVTDTLAEMEAETPGDTVADLKVKAPLSALGDKGGD